MRLLCMSIVSLLSYCHGGTCWCTMYLQIPGISPLWSTLVSCRRTSISETQRGKKLERGISARLRSWHINSLMSFFFSSSSNSENCSYHHLHIEKDTKWSSWNGWKGKVENSGSCLSLHVCLRHPPHKNRCLDSTTDMISYLTRRPTYQRIWLCS